MDSDAEQQDKMQKLEYIARRLEQELQREYDRPQPQGNPGWEREDAESWKKTQRVREAGIQFAEAVRKFAEEKGNLVVRCGWKSAKDWPQCRPCWASTQNIRLLYVAIPLIP